MEFSEDEKKIIRFLLEKNLKEMKGEEVTKDASLKLFAAEKEYQEFLETLIKKFR